VPASKDDVSDPEELADLIEEETEVDWPKAREMLPTIPTGTLLGLMGRLGLYVNRRFALEVARRSDAVFWLRRFLQDGKNWTDREQTSAWAPIHAAFILPQIKGTEALRLLLDLVRFRGEELGDFVTEDVTSLLYAFGPEGYDAILEFSSDETLEPFGRAAAIDALAARAVKDPAFRTRTVAHLRRLLSETKDPVFCTMLADALLGLDRTALPEVLAAHREGRLDSELNPVEEIEALAAGEFQDLEKAELERDTSDPMEHFTRQSILQLREAERSWEDGDGEDEGGEDEDGDDEGPAAGERQRAAKGPSKNAPCPCGSGKKYKRCCMPGKER
jgi:hypothetical protein